MLTKSEFEEKIALLKDVNVDINVKNKIAIVLSETKSERVYDVLIGLILDRSYINKRGTFVYCLRNYPPEKSFEIAVDLLINGNFEVSNESFEIISQIDNNLEGQKVIDSYDKLSNFINTAQNCEDWRIELIELTLDMFD